MRENTDVVPDLMSSPSRWGCEQTQPLVWGKYVLHGRSLSPQASPRTLKGSGAADRAQKDGAV